MSSQSVPNDIISHNGTQVVRIRRRRRRPVLERRLSLSKLGREYQHQARYDFVQEAVILALIALASIVWPAVHTVQIIAEAF